MILQHKGRRALFKLGRTVATPGSVAAMQKAGQSAGPFLQRHVTGDWGEVCLDDVAQNDAAVAHEGDPDRQTRVMSVYRLSDDTVIWVITEHDRSVTTILLPEDY